jgi:transglutaminase-like putative cysteine protease
MREFLEPGPVVDSDHPQIVAFAQRVAGGSARPRDVAVKLYYAVRDGLRYDPYDVRIDVEGLRASNVLRAGRGWCTPKAGVLAAACRALGIPARLGFADVRNHLSTARMRASMSSDVFYWHGYTSIWLDERWIKATPAFNVELCRKFRLLPLEFDGSEDSIYHAFDQDGRRHMEYLAYRGEFADVPIEAMLETFRARYPNSSLMATAGADFERDVEAETRG